jgi:serine phosphatase RsbU (regulator of sigma subunit)
MKPFIYIILFLISFNGVSQIFSDAQQYQIDSLNAVIANPNSHDTSLAISYVALSEILYVSNIDTLKSLCETSKLIAEKSLLKNNSEIVKKSLKISLAAALNNIGYIYNAKGQTKEAVTYFSRSLKISEEIGDKKGIASSLNNLISAFNKQGQVKEVLDYLSRSLKTRAGGIINKSDIAASLNNLGTIHNSKGQLKEALAYYSRSLKIREEIGDKNGIASSLNNIGIIHNKQGQVKEALDYLNRSLKLREEIGSKPVIATCLNNIGVIYNDQDQLNKALVYGLKSLTISQEIGSPACIERASGLLSEVYEKEGKGIKALEMYKLFITMRDSLENKETQKAATLQQAKYAYEKQKTLDAAVHDKRLAIEQEEKEQQQILTGAIAVGLGMVVIFLLFVFNRLRITRKQKTVIEQQKVKVEQQKEVVELAHDELEEKNQEIMDSIIYAKRIQSAILPPVKVVKEYLKESFILYKPKDVVAGDFYWMEQKNGKVLFAAADCTGHGVPGAMVSVVCNNALNRSVREHGLTIPGEILDKTREIVVQEFKKSEEDVKDGMDIALCSIEGMKLQYAGAYNPLWIIRNGEVIETKANKQPIGQFDDSKPYTTHSFDLEKGDAIYIFSDGYVDQFGGERGKKFKSKAFRELLLSIQDKTMEEQKITIDKVFETWKGNLEQIDDVCVIGLRV